MTLAPLGRPLALALFATALPTSSALAANCGGATVCACDDTITSDYTMTADLICSAARSVGLTIAAPNITLDGNGHFIRMARTSSKAVVITGQPGATVQNLTVTITAVTGVNGITLDGAADATLTNNVLNGLGTGITAVNAVSSNLEITGNSVNNATAAGMDLRSIDSGLVLLSNSFTDAKNGLRIDNLVGPWALDASNTFLRVGRADTDYVIRLDKSVDVTIDGLDLSASGAALRRAIGVDVNGSTNLTITNNDLSNRDQGVFTEAFGSTFNPGLTITGNDVSGADLWGMALEDCDESLVLGDNDFSSSDNGLRIADFDPVGTYNLDLSDSVFDQVGEGLLQTGLKIVRSHDMVITNFQAFMVDTGTGLKLEDSDHIDVDNVLVCGTTNTGIDLGINSLAAPGPGADNNFVGSPGNAYVDNAAQAGVRVSVQSTDNVLDVVARGAGVPLLDNAPVGETTGTVSRVGVPGWAFTDTDGDTCNDLCGDGEDIDADTFCDDGDFQPDTVILDNTDVPWTTGGVGSPSVVFDTLANAWVMVFETQTAAADTVCKNGYWSLGLATSPDGVTWTDSGGPLLSPTPGTYHSCVAAHPTIVQNGGTTVIFFKGETEAVNGFAQYAGIGRMLISWNGAGYNVTAPDPTVVLAEGTSFGYPRAVFDSVAGIYRFVVSRFPNVAVTEGPAAGPLDPLTQVLVPGDVGWGPDELFNPAVACGQEDDGWSLFLGGRTLSGTITAPVVDDQGLGRLVSSDFTSWAVATIAAVVSTTSGDPELRHWDVVPLGAVDYALFFDDKGGPGGTNQIIVANTGGSPWNAALAATHGDKVCAP